MPGGFDREINASDLADFLEKGLLENGACMNARTSREERSLPQVKGEIEWITGLTAFDRVFCA